MSALSREPSKPEVGNSNRGVERITGRFALGSSGAVGALTGLGFSVTKVAEETGQYLVQCDKAYKEILHVHCTLWGAEDNVQGAKHVGTPSVGDRALGASFTLQTFEEAPEESADDTSGVTAPADLDSVSVSFEAVFANVE